MRRAGGNSGLIFMAINYKYKTHSKNSVTGKSKCGRDDVNFSDTPECRQCINVDKRQKAWILKENMFKKGMQ